MLEVAHLLSLGLGGELTRERREVNVQFPNSQPKSLKHGTDVRFDLVRKGIGAELVIEVANADPRLLNVEGDCIVIGFSRQFAGLVNRRLQPGEEQCRGLLNVLPRRVLHPPQLINQPLEPSLRIQAPSPSLVDALGAQRSPYVRRAGGALEVCRQCEPDRIDGTATREMQGTGAAHAAARRHTKVSQCDGLVPRLETGAKEKSHFP